MTSGIALARELGITYRQLWHWESRNYVRATGDTLDFDSTEERVLRIMAGLVAFGMKPEPAASIARKHVESKRRNSIIDIGDVGFLTIGG